MSDRTGVGALDAMPEGDAEATLGGVCASARWVQEVLRRRPFGHAGALYAAADEALAVLGEGDVDEALAGHPRIGERTASVASRREQAGVGGSADEVLEALAEANATYEARFGHVYLVCASGRTGAELLAEARRRLGNEPAVERAVVRRELGRINRLRLERLVEGAL